MNQQPPLTKGSAFLLFAAPLLLFVLAAAAIHPFYQYRIVSDDISYLTIARRYLEGDYATAVNGYWSPLNIWLLVLLVKVTGLPLLTASYILNCFSFAGVLLLGIRLCRKFITGNFELLCFGLCSAVFWAANIPVTHFADALNCFLLLGCLLLLLRDDFTERKILWVVYGLLSAIAYFSKAYSFYILPLSTAVLLWIRLKNAGTFRMVKWLGIIGTTTVCMILFSVPWLWLLHQKYGQWMISSAGGINTNWAVKGYMYFSKDYPVVVPPAHADGLSCWEDPWINHGDMISPFGSATLLGKQLFRIAMNALQWFRVTAEFSPFYFPIWLAGCLYLLQHKIKAYALNRSQLILAFLLFPAGYFTLSFGTRYLWFTVPLVMIGGLLLLRDYVQPLVKARLYRVLVILFFASWLPGATLELKATLNEGKEDHKIAEQLKAMGIKGSFVTADYMGYQRYFRISWFSGNKFYMHFGDNWTTAELLKEAGKLDVQYYYYSYSGTGSDYQLLDASGKPYPEVTGGRIGGLKIFQIR